MKEVSRFQLDGLSSFRTVLQAKATRHNEGIEMAGTMMVPTRDSSSRNPRPRNDEVLGLECLLPSYPLRHISCLQLSPTHDFNSQHRFRTPVEAN